MMTSLIRIATGVLLVTHGVVHLLYLAPDVSEFSFDRSWLAPETASRAVAWVLMWATVAAFALLGLVVWGVRGLAGAWPVTALIASVLSLALLVAFWNWSLMFGVLIDLALITAAVIRPEWTERIVG